ncbi:MAG TPA: metallophosphoesterase [Verrucomicrobiales bacterium]|nr:metallophosphoesterase [Verrucomicrobiales bacterium]
MITFVWPGDLHLEFPDRDNVKVARWMTEEVNTLIKPDFVQFAGDNVQHAREPEWALFADVTSRLTMPWHALVGDHDAHHDPRACAYQSHVGATNKAYSLRGYRFICLNTMQSKPLGMTKEQLLWFRYEVDTAIARGERVVVFQHHYPFQIWEDFLNCPGMEEWREIVQTRPILALFAGHTHYGQMANDGRNIYIATRSIGEPEGGPAGFAIVTLDGDDLAITYRSHGETGPAVQITHPRRLILCTKSSHIVTGPAEYHVRTWSREPVASIQGRIDEGAWTDLTVTSGGTATGTIPGNTLPKGEHSLEVRATDSTGATGSDKLTFLSDLSGRFNPYPAVEPEVKYTKFC